MRGKQAAREAADPLVGLRQGWDVVVEFALQQPALLQLMVERANRDPELAREARASMRCNLERMSLSVSVDAAARAMEAASSGLLTMVAQGGPAEEVREASGLLFEAILGRVVG